MAIGGTAAYDGLSHLPDTRLFSVERDDERAAAAASVFSGHENITVLHEDWVELYEHGPFDLLVLDGGAPDKGSEVALDLFEWLNFGGMVVIDDFTPATEWPPTHLGEPDRARLQWLEHPMLRATEVRLAPDLAAVVATRIV